MKAKLGTIKGTAPKPRGQIDCQEVERLTKELDSLFAASELDQNMLLFVNLILFALNRLAEAIVEQRNHKASFVIEN